jgi:putative flippase GtrA
MAINSYNSFAKKKQNRFNNPFIFINTRIIYSLVTLSINALYSILLVAKQHEVRMAEEKALFLE